MQFSVFTYPLNNARKHYMRDKSIFSSVSKCVPSSNSAFMEGLSEHQAGGFWEFDRENWWWFHIRGYDLSVFSFSLLTGISPKFHFYTDFKFIPTINIYTNTNVIKYNIIFNCLGFHKKFLLFLFVWFFPMIYESLGKEKNFKINDSFSNFLWFTFYLK